MSASHSSGSAPSPHDGKELHWFLALFIENSRLTYLTVFFVLMIGGFAAWQAPKESSPKIDFGIITVVTVQPGISAVDADQLITQEIETSLKSVEGIRKVTSTSSAGMAVTTVELEPEVDATDALNEVRAAVDTASAKLPTDAEQPVIRKIQAGSEPIFMVHLVGSAHPALMRDYAETLKRDVERSASVKEVNVLGGAEREVVVELSAEKLAQYGVSASQVVQAIQTTNRDSPAGDIQIGVLEYTVRIVGRHQGAKDIAALPVVVKGDAVLTVGDVAEVKEAAEEMATVLELKDKTVGVEGASVRLEVVKADGIDIFKADPEVRELILSKVQERFGDEVQVYFTNELMDEVGDSYHTVIKAATEAILVVLLMLILFLRVKESLIAALVVPLSFAATIAYTFFMGNTLNFMVNFSLILALGIFVDIAIVIVQGMHQYLHKGMSPKDAARASLKEFAVPLVSGQLTTIAVFIPLFGLPGILGKYLSFVPVTVTIALVFSLIIAFTLIPGLAAHLLVAEQKDAPKSAGMLGVLERLYEARDRMIARWEAAYGRLLTTLLSSRVYRLSIVYVMIAVCAGTFMLPVKFVMFPSDDFDFFQIAVELPQGTVRGEVRTAVAGVEEILLKQPEIRLIQSSISDTSADIRVELLEKKERKEAGMRTSIVLSDQLAKEFLRFGNYEVRIDQAESGPPVAAPVAFRITAERPDLLPTAREVLGELKPVLAGIQGTTNVRDDLTEIPGEQTYRIDRVKAARLGVSEQVAATTLRAAVDGIQTASITRGEREVDIVVRYPEARIPDFDSMLLLSVPTSQGGMVPLSEVVTGEFGGAVSEIQRTDGEVAISLMADLALGGNATEITAAFKKEIEGRQLPSGITVVDAGENAENTDLFMALGIGFVVAIVLIFSILVVQFNSFAQPGIVLFTIVMSLIGVNLGLFLTDTPRSLAFIIGFISLAGIVVNHSIILVDQINHLHRFGNAKDDLIPLIGQAGASRLMPMLLTTIITLAGIGPLILVDTFWAGLAITIVCGLFVGTALTLLVTPAMYYQMEREGAVTFAPLVLLPGIGMVIGGVVSLFGGTPNVPLLVVGGVLVVLFGRLFVGGVARLRMQE